MEPRELEREFLILKDKFDKMFPNQEIIDEFAKQSNRFYKMIDARKPLVIISPKIMSKVLEKYPNMRANQIDDFLLENKIGSEKALIDFLDLEEKNRTNTPLVKDEES